MHFEITKWLLYHIRTGFAFQSHPCPSCWCNTTLYRSRGGPLPPCFLSALFTLHQLPPPSISSWNNSSWFPAQDPCTSCLPAAALLSHRLGPGGPSWQSGLCLGVTSSERPFMNLKQPGMHSLSYHHVLFRFLLPTHYYLMISSLHIYFVFCNLPPPISIEPHEERVWFVLAITASPAFQILPSTQHTFNHLPNERMLNTYSLNANNGNLHWVNMYSPGSAPQPGKVKRILLLLSLNITKDHNCLTLSNKC